MRKNSVVYTLFLMACFVFGQGQANVAIALKKHNKVVLGSSIACFMIGGVTELVQRLIVRKKIKALQHVHNESRKGALSCKTKKQARFLKKLNALLTICKWGAVGAGAMGGGLYVISHFVKDTSPSFVITEVNEALDGLKEYQITYSDEQGNKEEGLFVIDEKDYKAKLKDAKTFLRKYVERTCDLDQVKKIFENIRILQLTREHKKDGLVLHENISVIVAKDQEPNVFAEGSVHIDGKNVFKFNVTGENRLRLLQDRHLFKNLIVSADSNKIVLSGGTEMACDGVEKMFEL